MAHASSIHPGLGHPRADLEDHSGPATLPPCREEVDRCLEAGTVHQHQQDLEIQLGAPTPPPEAPDVCSRETEMPNKDHRGQDALEDLIPLAQLLKDLGPPANVDETPQTVPASTPPPPQQAEEHNGVVVPMDDDPPFLDYEAMKWTPEYRIANLKTQQNYPLPTRVLEDKESSEDIALGQNATQPPPLQGCTELPKRSPFWRGDRHVETTKPAEQLPGPQDDPADPLDLHTAGSSRLCPERSEAPRHSLPGSEGSQTSAPSAAAGLGAGTGGMVEERPPP